MQTSSPKKRIPLILRLLFGALLATLSVIGGLCLIVVVWVRTMHHPWFRDRLIRLNKQTLNPITLKRAGHYASIYTSVKHVGRHSGREYMTPVVAKPLGDGFVIPLPYEADVDWCRNVLAAGTCTLLWNEHEYIMERPEILPLSGAIKAFPVLTRLLYAAGGIKQYLWLHQQKEVSETVSTNEATSLPTPTLSEQ